MSSNQSFKNENEEAYASLTKGLKELDLQGPYVPSDLVLIGDHAFPLAMNSRGQVLMAASLYGSGRIVVLGHEGYLTAFPALVENAVTWLRGDGSDNLSVGVQRNVCAVADRKDFKDDLELLLKGVSEFNLPSDSVFSEVLVHGPLAFPIGTTEDGCPFLAGAYYGRGRVIVVTHESSLASMAPFWRNAIHWLDEGRRGVVGVMVNPALKVLSESGLKCEKTNFRKDLSVFVCKAYITEHLEEIQNFVAEGGGLLIGGHAWHWAQTHAGQNPLTDFSVNKMLNQMGLSLLGATIRSGTYKALVPSWPIKDTYHFRHLLYRFVAHVTTGEELSKHEEGCLQKLGSDCDAYLHTKAHGSFYYTQVLAALTDILMSSSFKVSDSCPAKTPKDKLLLSVGSPVYKFCPNPEALLPYLIKDNPLMPDVHNHRLKIDVNTEDGKEWISTGLYLSPGMSTYMVMPAETVNKHWKIQIGCQTDDLHRKDELKRPPRVCERFPVTSEMMHVSNLWGGLIYLVAPPNTQVKGLEITVQKAVTAPYYKSGVTTAAEWSLLRTAPGPWAELEFENIVLTVPSDAVRGLEHPDKVAALWDEIMRAIADLAAKPHKFPRKERFVTDVQISAGWMHSGYPIMAHHASAAEVVDVKKGKQMWGPIHELGHNQQRSCWEFRPHTTDATCNLWSVFVNEEVLGLNRAQAHGFLTSARRKTRVEEYIKGGKKLSDWSVWVALETYLQLQEKFGWDAFKKVFAAYHHMSNFPNDNDSKMNLYAETFSQTVGMNLTGFFKAWGWPIETATEEKLSQLPPWNDHPMTQYK
uniref:Peptidase M60 domain-containing protein n=1 Tax=Oreochromis aureus TaxID=47969 RepID=A0A668T5G3_OREAU